MKVDLHSKHDSKRANSYWDIQFLKNWLIIHDLCLDKEKFPGNVFFHRLIYFYLDKKRYTSIDKFLFDMP